MIFESFGNRKKNVELQFFEIVKKSISEVLHVKLSLQNFITLLQAVEERLDPEKNPSNQTIAQLCDAFGIARSTFYRKRKSYLALGIWGIVPKRRGPKGTTTVSPATCPSANI